MPPPLPEAPVDPARAAAFADTLVGHLNSGALVLMISLGHRTGLFDAMDGLGKATSEHIARAAKLDERYVREWLGALLTGGLVAYDPAESTYVLPPEHAAFLTRRAAPDNLAVFAQYVPVLAQVEDEIVECFRTGGGVGYESFGRFHEVMEEDSEQSVVSSLLDTVLPLVDGVEERLAEGIDVLDVGCGRGRALLLLAATYPRSRFVGYDLSPEVVERANGLARARGLENVRFEARDVTSLGAREAFDLVTAFDAIHDQARPDVVLRGIHDALRPDGTFLMQDIRASSHVHRNVDHPIGPLLYAISCMHCMTVSLAQGGAGLGTMWGEELACRMLEEAGFEPPVVHRLEHDIQNNWYVTRRNGSGRRRGTMRGPDPRE